MNTSKFVSSSTAHPLHARKINMYLPGHPTPAPAAPTPPPRHPSMFHGWLTHRVAVNPVVPCRVYFPPARQIVKRVSELLVDDQNNKNKRAKNKGQERRGCLGAGFVVFRQPTNGSEHSPSTKSDVLHGWGAVKLLCEPP